MTVEQAIERSIKHNEIVTLDGRDLELHDVRELETIAEDRAINGDITEYWGTMADDSHWRVHVRAYEPGGEG